MKSKRSLIFRILALVVVLALAVCMFIIGRGHTIYFDNKKADYDGKTYEAYYKVSVITDKDNVSKLSDGDRGMADIMGQTLTMTLEITDEKGAEPHSHRVSMPVPYGMDGIIINIPTLMAGLPTDAYMSEFIVTPSQEDDEDEEVVIDEFEMSDDM